MFRLVGFIIGSMLAITALLLIVGMPNFRWSSLESDQARFEAALERIRDQAPYVSTPEPEPVANEPEPAPVVEPGTDDTEATEESASIEEQLFAELEAPPATPVPVVTELQWHEFWSPFRSEIAARGFVSRLERVTGLDYRITKVEAGVYQVGFAYADDNERVARLSQISAATGLDLPAQ